MAEDIAARWRCISHRRPRRLRESLALAIDAAVPTSTGDGRLMDRHVTRNRGGVPIVATVRGGTISSGADDQSPAWRRRRRRSQAPSIGRRRRGHGLTQKPATVIMFVRGTTRFRRRGCARRDACSTPSGQRRPVAAQGMGRLAEKDNWRGDSNCWRRCRAYLAGRRAAGRDGTGSHAGRQRDDFWRCADRGNGSDTSTPRTWRRSRTCCSRRKARSRASSRSSAAFSASAAKVLLTLDEAEIMQDDAGNIVLQTSLTPESLEGRPVYEEGRPTPCRSRPHGGCRALARRPPLLRATLAVMILTGLPGRRCSAQAQRREAAACPRSSEFPAACAAGPTTAPCSAPPSRAAPPGTEIVPRTPWPRHPAVRRRRRGAGRYSPRSPSSRKRSSCRRRAGRWSRPSTTTASRVPQERDRLAVAPGQGHRTRVRRPSHRRARRPPGPSAPRSARAAWLGPAHPRHRALVGRPRPGDLRRTGLRRRRRS